MFQTSTRYASTLRTLWKSEINPNKAYAIFKPFLIRFLNENLYFQMKFYRKISITNALYKKFLYL